MEKKKYRLKQNIGENRKRESRNTKDFWTCTSKFISK